jgi:hypothetical protein
MRVRKPKLTDAQERQAAAGERLLFRSQIIKAGVCESLKSGWPGPYDLDVQIKMLTEAQEFQED